MIGNPPWGAEIDYDLDPSLELTRGQFDSYELFVERGIRDALKPGGLFGFVIPDRLLRPEGERLRTKLEEMLAAFPIQIWSHQAIGGRDVLVSVAGSDKSRTYLRVAGDVLEQVETDDAALAQEAIAALH